MLLLLFFRVCLGLRAFASLNLALLFFSCGHVVAVFIMVRAQGWSYGALPGIAAPCLVLSRSA